MHHAGKLDNTIRETTRMNVDILGLAEVRSPESETLENNFFVIIILTCTRPLFNVT